MAVVDQAARGADRARELRDAAGLDLKALLPPYLESEQEKSEEVRGSKQAGHMLTARTPWMITPPSSLLLQDRHRLTPAPCGLGYVVEHCSSRR